MRLYVLTLTLNKGAVICTFATWSVRTTHAQRKQMWISFSYIDLSNRNKKYRLWNKALYVFMSACFFLCSYLLTNYTIWGWISALFLTSWKPHQKEELSLEQNEQCHIVIVSSLASLWQGQEAIQGNKYPARTISLHNGSKSKAPGSPGTDPLCSFCFFD